MSLVKELEYLLFKNKIYRTNRNEDQSSSLHQAEIEGHYKAPDEGLPGDCK
jgi:hypothetical protein